MVGSRFLQLLQGSQLLSPRVVVSHLGLEEQISIFFILVIKAIIGRRIAFHGAISCTSVETYIIKQTYNKHSTTL